MAGGLLWSLGVVRLHYEAQGFLAYSGNAEDVGAELTRFRAQAEPAISLERVPGQPLQIVLRAEGSKPKELRRKMETTSQACIKFSFDRQKGSLQRVRDELQSQVGRLEERLNQLSSSRKVFVARPKRNPPRAQIAAKIEELKTRRRLLIERFPTHTDIPLLAKQIKELLTQLGRPSDTMSTKLPDLDRQINEAELRRDYFRRRLQATALAERDLKPSWTWVPPAPTPKRPTRVDGWLIGAAVVFGLFFLGLFVVKDGTTAGGAAVDGLWRPAFAEKPVELNVISPEPVTALAAEPEAALPSDPLTEKAATLYAQWVEVAKILYQPALEPPQGVLDSVGPLLQETSEFLPEGQDVLTRYLARSVTPGDLAAHVARTVLMTLTGAQEAGVSPEVIAAGPQVRS